MIVPFGRPVQLHGASHDGSKTIGIWKKLSDKALLPHLDS